jgi:hypothetical protein
MNTTNKLNNSNEGSSKPAAASGPKVRSKYCHRCKLVVADLSELTPEEVNDYLVSHYNDRVCESFRSCDSKKSFSNRVFGWYHTMFNNKTKNSSVSYSH